MSIWYLTDTAPPLYNSYTYLKIKYTIKAMCINKIILQFPQNNFSLDYLHYRTRTRILTRIMTPNPKATLYHTEAVPIEQIQTQILIWTQIPNHYCTLFNRAQTIWGQGFVCHSVHVGGSAYRGGLHLEGPLHPKGVCFQRGLHLGEVRKNPAPPELEKRAVHIPLERFLVGTGIHTWIGIRVRNRQYL